MALTIQEGFSLFFSVENVTETEFESGRASNGIVSIGAPRLINGGIRLRF